MYPFIRLAWQLWRTRVAPPMGLTDLHVSHHHCLPWDLDGFLELNNGRTLTFYDIGRFTAGQRMGLSGALRRRRWGLAVAGASVRYRRRVTAFQKIEMRTRCVGWDHKFVYIVQSMWVKGTCTSQALLRTAVTSRAGTVEPVEVAREIGYDGPSPALPDWVAGWIATEGTRPWPPQDAVDVPEGHVPPVI
ncbi:Acyl-CoA thioesterase FadM [Jannaschia faecimaris]|uniref:Acyl-CoA thioesterase FadM n=1 Tax=Jannaschia faecimaris TaxID=1244108 RepID=A0A1H3IMU8_9RHOB|nr:acyl-CoA thioesterase [Jannaschia faecimaris]SDY29030.1 Acyl-CoA thioesterase FadM [Jannaschia faecimaris]